MDLFLPLITRDAVQEDWLTSRFLEGGAVWATGPEG